MKIEMDTLVEMCTNVRTCKLLNHIHITDTYILHIYHNNISFKTQVHLVLIKKNCNKTK